MPIPPFRADGYLPEGVHCATAAELTFRFGASSRTRRGLIHRVRRWIELARAVCACRLLIDGSFVTDVAHPQDVDAVVWLPTDFLQRVSPSDPAAQELEIQLLTRQPAEIFAAEDRSDWDAWVQFFSRTRESDERRKGLIEVDL